MDTKYIIVAIILLITLYTCFSIKEHYAAESINTGDKIIQKLYSLMKIFDSLCRKHNIRYWIDAGTMLGAVRHKGIIPWDDDIDICVPETDREKVMMLADDLKKHGCGLTKFWGDYKIYSFDGEKMKPENSNWVWTGKDGKTTSDKGVINYTFPFIDIYFVDFNKDTNTYTYTNPKNRAVLPKHYHNACDLLPLKNYKFGELTVVGVKNPMPYLDRAYPNWATVGIKKYDHQNMTFISKQVATF